MFKSKSNLIKCFVNSGASSSSLTSFFLTFARREISAFEKTSIIVRSRPKCEVFGFSIAAILVDRLVDSPLAYLFRDPLNEPLVHVLLDTC